MGTRLRRLSIVQVGLGTVGGELIEQVLATREEIAASRGIRPDFAAIVGRDGALVGSDGHLDEPRLREIVESRRQGIGLGAVAGGKLEAAEAALDRELSAGPVIVVDAAVGSRTAVLDARALQGGAGVVLSNKAPLALDADDVSGRVLWGAAGPCGRLRYEATCGAGLPIFATLRGLLASGDDVLEIQGAVSGTLGAIFSDVAEGTAFSAAIRGAMARGYTEPDPRDDLSGLDVARKALILARTLGVNANLSDVPVEGLVPQSLSAEAGIGVEEFLERASELDAAISARSAAARAESRALRYVATVGPDGPPTVGLRAVPTASVLGSLRGPENAVSIRTRRYDEYPLGISGPGAGAAVTAAGVLVDILDLAAELLVG